MPRTFFRKLLTYLSSSDDSDTYLSSSDDSDADLNEDVEGQCIHRRRMFIRRDHVQGHKHLYRDYFTKNQVMMTMPSSSNSNQPKKKKSKFVHTSKEQPATNWLELPSDLMANILHRVGVIDILENAQKVCTAWRKICKDPAMWRVIFMGEFSGQSGTTCRLMCEQAVDRSQGQLVDFTIAAVCSPELLQYVADRSTQLRRIEILRCTDQMCGIWSEALKNLSLLEELTVVSTKISQQDIEAAGRYCPLLKTLSVSRLNDCPRGIEDNEIALAVGKYLPQLTHLELIGNSMTNVGLQAILEGCCHLESLDLRGCLNLDLKGDLGKRCSQQIKHLRLPKESCEQCPPTYEPIDTSDDEYVGYSDYDVSDASDDRLEDSDDEYVSDNSVDVLEDSDDGST